MLLFISLCALATICAADKSGPNPEAADKSGPNPDATAEAQYNQGYGGGFYYPPQPPTYGNHIPYGNKGKGQCKVKPCSHTLSITETSFRKQTHTHEYNTIFPVHTTIQTTSFSWSDSVITKSACSKTPTYITHFSFVPTSTVKTIHECTPVTKLKTFTNWEPVAHVMTINQCVPTSITFTVQSITSTIGHDYITTVGFNKTYETKTHYIPETSVWKVPICTEKTKCTYTTPTYGHPTPPTPTYYPTPHTPTYGTPTPPTPYGPYTPPTQYGDGGK